MASPAVEESVPAFSLSDHADPALREVIYGNFAAHATAHGLASDFRQLSIRVERAGGLLGGLTGRTGRGWLYVEYLALPLGEHRGGLGRQLIGLAEQEAVRRGCSDAYLHTLEFQAPGFYEKLGYQEFARLPHDDPRLTRIWFRKRLA